MKHEEYSGKSFDGIEVFAQSWSPEGAARAAVALVHGQGDHSGRYPRLVERLVSGGVAVYATDSRGHGRTGGPRAYAPSIEALMKDIDALLDRTRARFPAFPFSSMATASAANRSSITAWRESRASTA